MSLMSRFRNAPINTLGLSNQWKRWFDTLKAQGVNRLADQSVGEARGMLPLSRGYEPTFDPRSQQSAVVGGGQSTQLNQQNPALDAILRIVGGQSARARRM